MSYFQKNDSIEILLKTRKSDNYTLKTCYEDIVYNNDKWVEDIR